MTMASSRLLLFSCYIVVMQLVALTTAQIDMPLFHLCSNENGNFTKKSSYQANLNRLLPSLSAANCGFSNASYGRGSDRVNAMALCRGDVKPNSCRSCINNSTVELRKRCPVQKEAIIWYDNCMQRYTNRYFFGKMEFGPYFWTYSLKNASNPKPFNRAVGALLDSLKNQAASGSPRRKFATGNVTVSKSQSIYALGQCTPDLSKEQCRDCLNNATALLPKCCAGRQGGRVAAPSCNFRYETGRFFRLGH